MKLLTVKQYAEQINLPISTVRDMCHDHRLTAVKIGVSWRIDPEKADRDIEAMMEREKEQAELKKRNRERAAKRKQSRGVVASGTFLERLKAI